MIEKNRKYAPFKSIKILKSQNIWNKKIEKLIDDNGWDWLYVKYKKITDTDYKKNKSFLIGFKIANIMVYRIQKNKKSYSLLCIGKNSLNEAIEIYDFIEYVCLKKDINIPSFINGWLSGSILLTSAIRGLLEKHKKEIFKIQRLNTTLLPIPQIQNINDDLTLDYKIRSVNIAVRKNKIKKRTFKKAFKIVSQNIFKIIDYHNNTLSEPLNYPQTALSKFFEITLDEAKKVNIKLKVKNTELRIDNKQLINEIELLKIIKSKIKNKRSFKYALKNPDHYLNIILNDTLEVDISKKEPSIYFKNLLKAVKYGAYEKGLYFGSYKYKRELINEFQKAKEAFKLLDEPLIKEHIKILDDIINFLDQDKRVAGYIMFKELEKHTKASKKQIKSFIKSIFSYNKDKKYEKIENKITPLNHSIYSKG